jgi:TrmH family RNA methyltransferase
MDSAQRITSLQNPRIKNVVRLNGRRQREQQQLTLVEGLRETGQALDSGVVPVEAFVCPELIAGPEATAVMETLSRLAAAGQTQLFEVTTAVFEKIAYRGQSGGVLLVIPYRSYTLADLPLSARPFLAIIDGAEKPGNVGAILRTADGAGVDALLLAGDARERTDMHNPNVMRASLGASFTVPTAAAPTAEMIAWLRAHEIAIVATTPAAEAVYTAVDLSGPVALVLGSEAFGLGPEWLAAADLQVRIPMAGAIDSLNLSVAAALLLYEVVRQRGGGAAANGRM